MEDRYLFFDSKINHDYGIEKREILKANSSGSLESLTGFQASFFYNQLPQLNLPLKKALQQVLIFVAEPAEIPIFRNPDCLYRQLDGYHSAARAPLFFNST